MNLIKTITSSINSKCAIFNTFAGAASITALYGWAAEKFLDYTPQQIGLISFIVIAITTLFSIYFLIAGYIFYAKMAESQTSHALIHTITHQLRNAIGEMQDLEYITSKKIEKVELEAQFPEIKLNDELKRQALFKKFASKVCNTVAKQLKNHFNINQISGNIRTTIKVILPEGKNQLDWKTVTSAVDSETWNEDDRFIEAQASGQHKIGENSDFEGIITGKQNCFVCNDLTSLPEKQYKNSSPEWRKRYNSTIVVPIKSKPDGRSDAVYYGFLTADSLNKDNHKQFEEDINSPTLNILAHAADALAVWFIKNDNHAKTIGQREIEQTGLLELANFIEQQKQKTQEVA